MGIRQKNAPIAVREKFALTQSEVKAALSYLTQQPGIAECAIVTTCNRTELYLAVHDTLDGIKAVQGYFINYKQVNVQDFPRNVFRFIGEDAVIHLLRVASGLDSLIVGEGQILNQVKDALATAQIIHTSGTILDKLFKQALSTGKRVRTETGIATKDVSVSRAAYQLAKQIQPNLLDDSIALIGGGKMATLLMNSLQREMTDTQQKHVVILNRSETRLKELTEKYGFRGVGWPSIKSVLEQSNVLFVATGAPHTVLHAEDFAGLSDKLIIDISMPRNVHPEVGQLDHVTLYNTDDLANVHTFTPEKQTQILTQAEQIITEEAGSFEQWQQKRTIYPTIVNLRSKVEDIRQNQLASVRGLSDEGHARLDKLSKKLVNQILHEPITSLKTETCAEALTQKADVVKTLFNIPKPSDTMSTR